jgi:hypothetical protein
VRYHAQRILTGEWLHRDLPLSDGVTTRALSGPGGITGSIEPELRDHKAADGLKLIEPWATAIYAEDDGQIRGAGIVVEPQYTGDGLSVEAPGFTTYPHGLIYPKATNFHRVDPLAVVRYIWQTIQEIPDGDLGIEVVGTDSTPETSWIGNNAEPYGLVWWETPDCGGEIDNLAQSTPFDYIERHSWVGLVPKDAVSHRVEIGYPRLGRRRTDLRFAGGENVTNTVPVTESGTVLANDIIGIGRGEGAAMVKAQSTRRNGRLRRTVVLTDKTATKEQITRLVQLEDVKRQNVYDVSEVAITDHPNARIASIQPGDDILVRDTLPWLGDFQLWVRVLAIAEDETGDTAVLSTRRSTAFTYSATVELTS